MIQLEVHFNPVPAAERVARWSGVVRARLVMFVISLAIAGLIWWWQHPAIGGWGFTLLILVSCLPLLWVILGVVMEFVARRDLARLGEGVALAVDRFGVRLEGEQILWPQLAKFSTRIGGPWRSPAYVIQGEGGATHVVPVDYLDVTPADLDNAVRAFSGGTRRVDLLGLGV